MKAQLLSFDGRQQFEGQRPSPNTPTPPACKSPMSGVSGPLFAKNATFPRKPGCWEGSSVPWQVAGLRVAMVTRGLGGETSCSPSDLPTKGNAARPRSIEVEEALARPPYPKWIDSPPLVFLPSCNTPSREVGAEPSVKATDDDGRASEVGKSCRQPAHPLPVTGWSVLCQELWHLRRVGKECKGRPPCSVWAE